MRKIDTLLRTKIEIYYSDFFTMQSSNGNFDDEFDMEDDTMSMARRFAKQYSKTVAQHKQHNWKTMQRCLERLSRMIEELKTANKTLLADNEQKRLYTCKLLRENSRLIQKNRDLHATQAKILKGGDTTDERFKKLVLDLLHCCK
jgi:cell division septum initiation protein DivIVA